MSRDTYVLSYWNIPGRGESIRVILTLGGLKFENNFVPLPLPLENPVGTSPPPFDDGSWGKLKPETPWGTLPTLTLPSGEIIGQQRSVLRYLGKKIRYEDSYLYPEDPIFSAHVDSFMDMLEDIWPILVGNPAAPDSAPLYSTLLGNGTLDDFLDPRMEPGSGDLAFQFDRLENAISESGPFILGRLMSCADVLLFAAIAWWGAGVFPDMEKMLATRPRIKRVIERVGNIDVVSEYYAALKDSRESLPVVGSTKYSEYYKNFHSLCGLN